jgi:hypothetical protein
MNDAHILMTHGSMMGGILPRTPKKCPKCGYDIARKDDAIICLKTQCDWTVPARRSSDLLVITKHEVDKEKELKQQRNDWGEA